MSFSKMFSSACGIRGQSSSPAYQMVPLNSKGYTGFREDIKRCSSDASTSVSYCPASSSSYSSYSRRTRWNNSERQELVQETVHRAAVKEEEHDMRRAVKGFRHSPCRHVSKRPRLMTILEEDETQGRSQPEHDFLGVFYRTNYGWTGRSCRGTQLPDSPISSISTIPEERDGALASCHAVLRKISCFSRRVFHRRH